MSSETPDKQRKIQKQVEEADKQEKPKPSGAMQPGTAVSAGAPGKARLRGRSSTRANV
jgi:hypothetical protein